MRYFITGSTGFIGRNLVPRLAQHELYLYQRGENISQAVEKFRPDYVINLAGEFRDESKMVASNGTLVQDLLFGTRFVKPKSIVHVGSSSEYGIKTQRMREDMDCEPVTWYGRTKMSGTAICLHEAKMMDQNVMVVRPFSVYGSNDSPDRFVPAMIDAALTGKQVEVWAGNHDWTHVDDFIDGLLFVSQLNMPGEIFNVATGVQTANIDIVRMIEDKTGKVINKVRHYCKKRTTDSTKWVADISKLRNLGWRSKIGIYEGIGRTVDEFKAARG